MLRGGVFLFLAGFALAAAAAAGGSEKGERILDVAVGGVDVLASEREGLIPSPHLGRVTRSLLDKARLEKARVAYQRQREAHYRALVRKAKSASQKREARFKYFEANTREMKAAAKRQELEFRARASGSYAKWRRTLRNAKEYNHLRGYKGTRFDVRPCLRACKSLDDKTCYKACYRMAYKRLLTMERIRMVKLFPKDKRYRACSTNAYDFELLRASINARRERRAHASTSSSRNEDHERVTGGNTADNAALAYDGAVERVYADGADPSWTRIAHESVERTLSEAMPAINALTRADDDEEEDSDVLLAADRDWGKHWAKVRTHNAKSHWVRETLNGMKRDNRRRAEDESRRKAALKMAREDALERMMKEKVAEEQRHAKLRAGMRGAAARERRVAQREADAAASMQRASERKAAQAGRRRLAIRKVVLNRAARDIESHAMRINHLKARAMGYRHQHELSDFLHEARKYNERCLRGAQRRARAAPDQVEATSRNRKPLDPLHDKDLIYKMTLETSKKMIRRWLLYWRALKRHELHSIRARHDARRQFGDDDDIPGHLERNGQGPPHWLFGQGLAAPTPDRIAVSKFVGHKGKV